MKNFKMIKKNIGMVTFNYSFGKRERVRFDEAISYYVYYTSLGNMWYNDLLLVSMVFVVILMIVMAIVVSTWSRRPKSEAKLEPPEKIFVEKGFKDKKVESENLSEQIVQQEENNIPDLENLESSYPEDEEIQLENKILTEPKKHKVVIKETSEPLFGKSDPNIGFEPKNEIEETIEIERIDPIIFEDLDRENSTSVSIEEQPTSLLEQEPMGIESFDPIILEKKKEQELSPIYGVEPDGIQKLEGDPIEVMDEIELSSISVEEAKIMSDEVGLENEKERLEETYQEPISEVVEKETEVEKLIPPSRRVRKPVIDESDPDLKIDLGVETCPHCGSKVPNTIYCIYCGKSLEIGESVE